MNLFYRSSQIWDSYKDADYIFTKHFTIPVGSDRLFVKVVQDGLIISPTINGLDEMPNEKEPSGGMRKLFLEDLMNITRPYLLTYRRIEKVFIDQDHGLLEVVLPDDKIKYRIVQSSPMKLSEASQKLSNTLSANNVPVIQKHFIFYDKWKRSFLIFVTLAVIAIAILVVMTE